jgi:putative phosphoribosyl transferase
LVVYKKLEFEEHTVTVQLDSIYLEAELVIPEDAKGIIIVPHASSSIQYSYHYRYLAHLLRQAGLATILIHLLTVEEDNLDQRCKHFRCDIRHLANRLIGITDWLGSNPLTCNLKICYCAESTDGGASLLAATERPVAVGAVVSRGARTDLLGSALSYLQTPTLLIVGGKDYPTLAMNEDALKQIATVEKRLEIIPEATHQFKEPGALEEVARLASQWFKHHLEVTESKLICY